MSTIGRTLQLISDLYKEKRILTFSLLWLALLIPPKPSPYNTSFITTPTLWKRRLTWRRKWWNTQDENRADAVCYTYAKLTSSVEYTSVIITHKMRKAPPLPQSPCASWGVSGKMFMKRLCGWSRNDFGVQQLSPGLDQSYLMVWCSHCSFCAVLFLFQGQPYTSHTLMHRPIGKIFCFFSPW